VLYSSNKNTYFETFTDYTVKALRENGCQTFFFDNRDFILPGRIRDKVHYLRKFDLRRLNKKLLGIAGNYRPELFIENGGWNILPDTVDAMKALGIKTALWINDVPWRFDPIKIVAPHYDFVFAAGTEAIEILKAYNIKRLNWLPFACDPDLHKPVELSLEEKKIYGSDICFIGSGNPSLYPWRRKILEALADFDLGIWGPGWNTVPIKSSLGRAIKGGHVRPAEWIKIYSASKISICIHYRDPEGKIPCYQAAPRVYEALACGVLLIVDRQLDVLSLFKPDEDLVIFDEVQEIRELVSYYLRNAKEAKKIGRNGRKKVLAHHTYRHRVEKLLDIVMKG
jgi:spore maturation protein CgeB